MKSPEELLDEFGVRELPVGRKANGATGTPSTGHFKTAAQFCAEYVPLSYAIEPFVRSSCLYTLTAKTGAGKTAWLVVAALAIATGRPDILGCDDVSEGRVAYLVFENPDDARMRLMIAAFLFNIDFRQLADRLIILDVRLKPEEVTADLARMAASEPFTLIIMDTFAGGFDGDDVNNPVQGGDFMRRIRSMTRLPGFPSVVVAAHPVKHATEEQLIPYGSGAILNEVDGNLTLWKKPETGVVSLHSQGKMRGIEFLPVPFRFELVGSPDVLDVKGRQVLLPVLRPIKAEDVEARERTANDTARALLKAMVEQPKATQREWANAIGRPSVNSVVRALQKLEKKKLVERSLDCWKVTPKGTKALADAA